MSKLIYLGIGGGDDIHSFMTFGLSPVEKITWAATSKAAGAWSEKSDSTGAWTELLSASATWTELPDAT